MERDSLKRLSPLEVIHQFCKVCNGVDPGEKIDPVIYCTSGVAYSEGSEPCILYPYRMGILKNRSKSAIAKYKALLN